MQNLNKILENKFLIKKNVKQSKEIFTVYKVNEEFGEYYGIVIKSLEEFEPIANKFKIENKPNSNGYNAYEGLYKCLENNIYVCVFPNVINHINFIKFEYKDMHDNIRKIDFKKDCKELEEIKLEDINYDYWKKHEWDNH